jgi:hypothetical protein
MVQPRDRSGLRTCAQRSTEWEATPLYRDWQGVYATGGSGEPTRTELLAGATPQTLRGAIPRGSTSSTAHGRKVVRRRVATVRMQRMGRKVHSPLGRNTPSLFLSAVSLISDGARLVCL